jgi:hypothetical protein
MTKQFYKCVLFVRARYVISSHSFHMVTTVTVMLFLGCLSKKIPVKEVEQSSQTVQLRVYQYNDLYYVLPSFNVTMTNIKWNGTV